METSSKFYYNVFQTFHDKQMQSKVLIDFFGVFRQFGEFSLSLIHCVVTLGRVRERKQLIITVRVN